MQQIRRVACLILVCTVFLAGCQNKEKKIVYQEAKDQEKTEISFLTSGFDGDNLTLFEPIINDFQINNPTIKVSFESYKDNQISFSEFIKNRIDHFETTDIVCMDVVNIFEYTKKKQILDLSQSTMAQNLNAIAKKDCLVDGQVMSLPTALSAYCMGVNMDILNQCHLDIPTNWEEFMHCCEVLKANGYQPIVGTTNFPKMFVLAGGLSQIYFDGNSEQNIKEINTGQTKISHYAKRGFEMLEEIISKGYLDADEALKHKPSDTQALFQQEKGCFVIGNSTGFNVNKIPFQFNLIPFPIDNGNISIVACDRRMTIMSDSQHVEECLNFMSYLTDEKAQKISLSTFGRLPAYKTESQPGDKRMNLINESLEKNRVMLIQDYELVFEQWGNLNQLTNDYLKERNLQKELDAFDRIQSAAIEKKQQMLNK